MGLEDFHDMPEPWLATEISWSMLHRIYERMGLKLDCSNSPRVIAVICKDNPETELQAFNQAESAAWEITEVRYSEFVKPGKIFWLCSDCGKEF